MLMIAFVMLVVLAIAALVMTFAAYPHRGQEVPRAPWLGQALGRAAEAMPIVENVDGVPGPAGVPPADRSASRQPAGASKGSARAG